MGVGDLVDERDSFWRRIGNFDYNYTEDIIIKNVNKYKNSECIRRELLYPIEKHQN